MKTSGAERKTSINPLESVVVTTELPDEIMEKIKEKIKKESESQDYELIIKSYDNGKRVTVGYKFSVVDQESKELLQYGDYVECINNSRDELHECADLMIEQCKLLKRMVAGEDV